MEHSILLDEQKLLTICLLLHTSLLRWEIHSNSYQEQHFKYSSNECGILVSEFNITV